MTTKDMNTPSEYSKFPTRKSAHKWAMENLNLDSQGRYRIHEMPTCYGTYSNWYVYYKLGQLKTGWHTIVDSLRVHYAVLTNRDFTIMSDLEYFRDWYNNWLTVERMSEHYNMPRIDLMTKIKRGKEVHNSIAGSYTHPAPKEI